MFGDIGDFVWIFFFVCFELEGERASVRKEHANGGRLLTRLSDHIGGKDFWGIWTVGLFEGCLVNVYGNMNSLKIYGLM